MEEFVAFERPVLETVSASVREDGHLVLGRTEPLPSGVKERFEAGDPRVRVYRRRTGD